MPSFFFVLLVLGFGSCDNQQSEPLPPIPYHEVMVEGVAHEVVLRKRCSSERPCELLPDSVGHWEIKPDGRVQIMLLDKELRFERGFFEQGQDGTSYWVPSENAEYLLASDGAHRVSIIHYPLTTTGD